jgi:hypothetical protein
MPIIAYYISKRTKGEKWRKKKVEEVKCAGRVGR